ncbi:MAG: 16S rRNA (guanine(527)-N(7))-methyltransferase RsmG [Lentihominibacter sp.]|nr:16S rRNA (guanine(527)-N(7))-methyltransferase RsmG [Clostridiales bacterium]MDY2681003.1 16S rRNA (guanine(527)-N(7))-methyltransferase RsmG [Lentihominibacter sp.]
MKNVESICSRLHINYDDGKSRKFEGYMESVLEKNKHINLTAITDRDEFIRKHYVDSLLCASSAEFRNANSVIDVGTGGGFPGIPLAIAFPEKEFVLIDSLNKRIRIINELCENYGIDNVTALHGRAEELGRNSNFRESFDICVSRAVANMSTLSEYCLPFVKIGGTFIAYKGPECSEELNNASNAIRMLGGEVMRIENPQFDELPFEHTLIYINKAESTRSKYPRKAGTPSKEPIK